VANYWEGEKEGREGADDHLFLTLKRGERGGEFAQSGDQHQRGDGVGKTTLQVGF